MKKVKAHILIIVLVLCAMPLNAQQNKNYYPLSTGTYWIYKGTVKWDESVNVVRSRSITWKMQVVKRLKNGPYEVAIIKGYPSDLCWYEPDRKPGDYLIAWQNNQYYLVIINNDLDKLVTDVSYLSSKATSADVILVAPLKTNMRFGAATGEERADHLYEWVVTGVKKTKLTNVIGLHKTGQIDNFTLTYQSLPEHEIIEFAPSIGIVSYVYEHHGQVSEVDVKLIEFHKK